MNPYTSTGSVSTVASNIAGGSSSKNNVRAAGALAPAVPLTTKQVTRRLMAFVRPHATSFATSFVSAGLSVVLQLYVPIVVGRAIDLIIGMGRVDFAALAPLLVQLALVVLAASALQWVQGYCVNLLTYRCVRDMRVDASEKIGRMPISFIDAHPHGDLISRVVNDVDQIGDGLLQGFNQLFTGVVTIVGTLLFMLSISVPMAVVVVLVTPLSIMAATLIAKFSNKSFTAQQRIQGQLGAHIEEYVGSQRLVSTFCYGDRAQERFDAMNGELYTAGERAQFLSSLSNPGTRFINNLIYAAVAVIGCMCVITGWPAPLTVGGVQTFLSYANQYTKPFNEVTNVITQLQTAYASARRLFALLDADEESPDKVDPEALAVPVVPSDGSAQPAGSALLGGSDGSARGEVVFDHVNFSYTPERPLLQDICIHAAPGQRIALVGPTGCGKTTLINLLLRFYDVQGGRIELDGVDIASYARADLRSRFGMVLQDTWLFEGTVHDNIAYGRPGATRGQVERAAVRAHADGFINALPQGFDTVIGEGGGTLSQGQRQLLCIARVMLCDPEILLLDEATSSIDTRTEAQVQAAFDELMRGRTSFVVAHRLSTIREADCILVMRDGQIIERGTHEQLLLQGGFYAELYNSQWVDE
ncbi:ABC transporter ATP-binding protein [Collinsella tanakaei]|uniref:ABC transporter ATP-binding protein n=1 Tax=Collinsella tanakaei TaxID=626935 RepID=UPI002F9328DF